LDEYNFENKQYVYVPDQLIGNYPTGQVTLDLAPLANSGKFFETSNRFITVPRVMVVANNGAILTSSGQNVFAASLKSDYHHLINSMQVQISNNDVVQASDYSNLKINYDIISTWGGDVVVNYGSVLGYYGPDDTKSMTYNAAVSSTGLGECNNNITPLVTTGWNRFTGWCGYNDGNLARRARMERNTSFDPNNTTNTPITNFTTAALCNTVGNNYVSQSNSTNTIVYYIVATIPLAVMHDLFTNFL
jgi:hypothetical protein